MGTCRPAASDHAVESPFTGGPCVGATGTVVPAVGDHATLWTDTPCPACRIAAFVLRLVGGTVHGEELDAEVHGTQRLDMVLDTGWDGLRRTCSQFEFDRRTGAGDEAQPAVVDDDPSPISCGNPMGPFQAGRHGALVPDRCGPYPPERVGHLGPLAQRTFEGCAEPGRPAFGIEDPGSQLERRAVAEMLIVPAFQLGDPVAHFVLVVTGDRSFHDYNIVSHARRCPCRPPAARRYRRRPML